MAIPQYEEHINPDTVQATAPEELHPLAAAFGGDIGAALEKTGEQISNRIGQLAQHVATMNYYRGQQAVADKVLQLKNEQISLLYGDPNNPNATVTKTRAPIDSISPQDLTLSAGSSIPLSTSPGSNQTYEVPAGILQRKGNDAIGALQDYHDWYTNYSQQVINQARNEGFGERNIRSLKLRMDIDFASNGRYIAKHESDELDKAQQQTFLKVMQLDADNAVTKQDPISLGRTIDSINGQNKILNDSQGKAADDPIRELTSNKFITQALNNSMTANLRNNGGDPTQFQSTLDRLHDDGKLNDTLYQNSSQHLDKLSNAIKTQNAIAIKTQTVNQRMNTMQSALQGKLDLNNPNVTNEISAQDPELGTALSNYNLNKNSNVKDENEAYAEATKKVFEAGSKEQVSKYMMNVLKEGKISQDRLNILFGAAADRGKNLADIDGQSKAGNPLQNLIDSGMKVLFQTNAKEEHPNAQTLTDYMTAVKNGKTVPEAIQHAQGQDAVRENPRLLNIPPNGQIFHDKYGNRRIVYPDLHTEAIGGKAATKSENGKSND